MSYIQTKSKFVKKEIQKIPWARREYIDDLLRIEKWALEGFHGPWEPVVTEYLETKYPSQCKIIFAELNPSKWKKLKQEDKDEKKLQAEENRKYRQEEAVECLRNKNEWQKMGGK